MLKEMLKSMEIMSPLMEDKIRVETAEVADKPVTIVGVDFVDGNNGEFSIILLKEYPDNFLFGGSVVTDRLKRLSNSLGGVDELNMVIDKEGGIPVVFVSVKAKVKSSKNGMYNTYTDMKVRE